jgi:hypothetical protein
MGSRMLAGSEAAIRAGKAAAGFFGRDICFNRS